MGHIRPLLKYECWYKDINMIPTLSENQNNDFFAKEKNQDMKR